MSTTRRTKIVATLGPASESPERIREMLRAGVDVVRLNFSHGTFADHERRLAEARRACAECGQTMAVLQDLPGLKLRVGPLRIFYDVGVDGGVVRILAVGRKQRNVLIIGGKEIRL